MPRGIARICNDATGAKTRFYVAISVKHCTRSSRLLRRRPDHGARGRFRRVNERGRCAVRTPAAPLAATLTGTVTTMLPVAAPEAMEQPARLVAPVAGQPLKVPPVAVIAPLVVMPAGSVSAMLIAAVVGPLATAIVIV